MMKRVGIISAMSIEMKLLQENMILEKELKICDFPFYVGAINNVPVILTTCSIIYYFSSHPYIPLPVLRAPLRNKKEPPRRKVLRGRKYIGIGVRKIFIRVWIRF